MDKKKVVVIGAGFGGLGSAILMARAGYDVTVMEKNDKVGGRANLLEIDGYKWDMGPSWYLMPDAFDRYFTAIGRKVEDYLDLQKLEPSYRVFFKDGKDGQGIMKGYESMSNGVNYLDLYADVDQAAETFEQIEQGSGDKLKSYLKSAAYQYGIAMEKFVFKNFDSIRDFMTPQLAIEGLQLNVFTKLYNYVSRFVKNENLKKLLMYPSVFLGTSPYETPALFNIMSHVDFNQGVFYPQGGIHEIPKALYQIALEEGVKFEFNAEVEKIMVEDKKVTGLVIARSSETIKQSSRTKLILVIGPVGSGKTTIAEYLHEKLGYQRFQVDKIRHELFNDPDFSVKEYEEVKKNAHEQIQKALQNGDSVIFDRPCSTDEHRKIYIDLASQTNSDLHIIYSSTQHDLIRQRIENREIRGNNYSAAKVEVFDRYIDGRQDFSEDVKQYVFDIINNGDKEELYKQLEKIISTNLLISLDSSNLISADIIISNADMRHTETQLLEPSQQTYPESYWSKQVISPSGFILYLGVDGELPQLKHHTLVFSDDWKGGFDQIFQDPQWPQDPNYYICNPSKTDPSVAPAGKENLFVLVPIAPGLESTPELLEAYRDHIIADIAHNCGIPDLQNRIEVSQIFSIPQFEQYYNAYRGTALGLAHTFFQSAVRRPQNYSKKVQGLYYAGGYTTPGIGMPMCLISAMMVADRVEKNK